MRIGVTSVFVDDQDKALKFYTETLGFQLKNNFPLGDGNSWLTVVSPEQPDGTELLLEPNGTPIASTFQKACFEQGLAAIIFYVDDAQAEHERLAGLGVEFTLPPTDIGPAVMAIFNDTCGNLLQIVQQKGG